MPFPKSQTHVEITIQQIMMEPNGKEQKYSDAEEQENNPKKTDVPKENYSNASSHLASYKTNQTSNTPGAKKPYSV